MNGGVRDQDRRLKTSDGDHLRHWLWIVTVGRDTIRPRARPVIPEILTPRIVSAIIALEQLRVDKIVLLDRIIIGTFDDHVRPVIGHLVIINDVIISPIKKRYPIPATRYGISLDIIVIREK